MADVSTPLRSAHGAAAAPATPLSGYSPSPSETSAAPTPEKLQASIPVVMEAVAALQALQVRPSPLPDSSHTISVERLERLGAHRRRTRACGRRGTRCAAAAPVPSPRPRPPARRPTPGRRRRRRRGQRRTPLARRSSAARSRRSGSTCAAARRGGRRCGTPSGGRTTRASGASSTRSRSSARATSAPSGNRCAESSGCSRASSTRRWRWMMRATLTAG